LTKQACTLCVGGTLLAMRMRDEGVMARGGHRPGAGRKPKPGTRKPVRKPSNARPTIWTVDKFAAAPRLLFKSKATRPANDVIKHRKERRRPPHPFVSCLLGSHANVMRTNRPLRLKFRIYKNHILHELRNPTSRIGLPPP
jgi:hypothetical protein